MTSSARAGGVTVPGLVDHHAHLLQDVAGVPFAWQRFSIREYHEQVWRERSTPMDQAEPVTEPVEVLAARLHDGLVRAARIGLVEVTEMGMRDWRYLDALALLQERGPLPARVRVYLASGLAEQASAAEIQARRAATGPWVRLDGVKFYADGWLGPRTCALCANFADEDHDGLLFTDAATLARRIEPLAACGLRIATHALGDRGIGTVLDAYELAWGRDPDAIAAAAPRIEHAAVQSREIADRITALGVVACLQPSFAVTDAGWVETAVGADRVPMTYPWASLAGSGARLLVGSDYPIEVLEPLVGLARLVNGHSDRSGFGTSHAAPAHSRLGPRPAFALMSDEVAGQTILSADPRLVPAGQIDQIEIHGTIPAPF